MSPLLSPSLAALLIYSGVLIVVFGFGLLVERAVRSWLRHTADSSCTPWRHWLANEGFHLVPSLLLAVFATRILVLLRPPAAALEPFVLTGLRVVVVVIVIRIGVDVGLASLRIRQRRLGFESVSILRKTLVGGAVLVALLVVLDQVGVSVAPLLATLGVGALALALALQPTLGNIFAGIQMVAAGEFKVGDFLRINDMDVEGYVTDINWRTTTLRTLLDNYVVIPNSQLSDSVLTNLYNPDTRVRMSIGVGVHYETDLEEAERIAREVIREVQDGTEAGVSGFVGDIRWTGFGDSAVTYDAILQARKPLDRFDLASEFIKRLHRRYQEADIEIPYPIRNLYLRTGLEVTGSAGKTPEAAAA